MQNKIWESVLADSAGKAFIASGIKDFKGFVRMDTVCSVRSAGKTIPVSTPVSAKD